MRVPERARAAADRWLDPLTAVAFTIAWTIELLTDRHRHGRLGLELAFVVVMTGQIAWRRRAPLAFAVVVMTLACAMQIALASVTANTAAIYVLLLPPYTVAAYEARTRSLIGLAVCLTGGCVIVIASGAAFGDFAFVFGIIGCAWAGGRALRARRLLADELERKAQRIAAEREGRVHLAIADERTRIARELHAVVAGSVSAMVVQSEAAARLLDEDLLVADEAMAAVEQTGREALAEMRRILGVLRRGDDGAELTPQPGVGQIHGLVERARTEGRHVELSVHGEPRPLPASVDLGLYRVLEEALGGGAADAWVALRFRDDGVELDVVSDGVEVLTWPTLAMRERVALCDGELDVRPAVGAPGRRLLVRMPRVFEEVFA